MKKYETYAKFRQGTGYKPAPAGGTSRNFMDWPISPDVRAFFYKFQRNFIHNNHQ